MTKRDTFQQKFLSSKLLGSEGQITIFFSTSVLVLITFMAFIINIGIFVKAKINLQNATDAAAYAGASVQARQLSNIAYLNWEMRNVYKEWMFKYYVLGGLNLNDVATGSGSGSMDFTMASYARTSSVAVDSYNFPSVCVDFAGTGGVGMCTRYVVPGLPRFESSNVLGMDETTNAFIDTIVSEKSKDCSKRSQINFFTANTWAYNVLTEGLAVNNISDQAPEIASHRMGAFPQAIELALRIRNLEAQVNKAPARSVCQSSGDGVNCVQSISTLASTDQTPSNERVYKAFYSGYRNLGSDLDNEMRRSFTLTEIPPTLNNSIGGFNSLSTLLIPTNHPANNKYYVDLKILTANLATFYTTFATTKGGLNVGGTTIDAEAQCAATKVGLPVPGYPMGFVKNPDFLTYYAVEGKAKFVGLFNPFANDIVLKAYSAAKPFGGRIGPMTFDARDNTSLKARSNKKSSPFIMALNLDIVRDQYGNTVATSDYKPGMPLPLDSIGGAQKFWLRPGDGSIGGWVSDTAIFFGIPNMAYDYPSDGSFAASADYFATNGNVEEIKVDGSQPTVGLYNRNMFNKLKSKLKGIGSSVSKQAIEEALLMVRAPTVYDTHNFMIPTPEVLNQSVATDSFGIVPGGPTQSLDDASGTSYQVYDMNLYAPIISSISSDNLYSNVGDVISEIDRYLKNQKVAIDKYVGAMNVAASNIYLNNRSGATAQNTGEEAAKAISDLSDAQLSDSISNLLTAHKPSCKSIAGKFAYFYTGSAEFDPKPGDPPCGISTLIELLEAYWANNQNLQETYSEKLVIPTNLTRELFSAYRPGNRHDASQGEITNPLNNRKSVAIRNFYSTKFIPLNSIDGGGSGNYNSEDLAIHSEGFFTNNANPEAKRATFKNPIDAGSVGIDLSEIKH